MDPKTRAFFFGFLARLYAKKLKKEKLAIEAWIIPAKKFWQPSFCCWY